MHFHHLVCPISSEKIDSHVSRVTVFINGALMIIFLFTLQPILLFIVTIDYGIRAFGFKQFSLLARISGTIINTLGAQGKKIDKAPKTFASRLGFTCAILGTVFILCGMPLASRIIISIFTLLAIMDSVFDFCMGCFIYDTIVFPFYKDKF